MTEGLIIDDNRGNRTSLQEILVANDFVVKTAASGKTGLLMLAEEAFDLVFIELEMPGKDSFVTCQTIKANSTLAGTPVIFIVGRVDLNLWFTTFRFTRRGCVI